MEARKVDAISIAINVYAIILIRVLESTIFIIYAFILHMFLKHIQNYPIDGPHENNIRYVF